jgi:hypothetical protein
MKQQNFMTSEKESIMSRTRLFVRTASIAGMLILSSALAFGQPVSSESGHAAHHSATPSQGTGMGMKDSQAMMKESGMMCRPGSMMDMQMMMNDPKTRGQMMEIHGRMMKEMGELMEKHGQELEQSK